MLSDQDNASQVQDLLSPGNYVLVQQGMQLNIVPTSKLDWPPPFKAATEKYSSQVALNPARHPKNYVAGQPFPLLDPNDPQMATKLMWNYSFRPLYTDDADLRFPGDRQLCRRVEGPRAAQLLHRRSLRLLQQRRAHRGAAGADQP